MKAERVQRRCRTCGKYITTLQRPWLVINDSGSEVAWHTTCPDPKEARRG